MPEGEGSIVGDGGAATAAARARVDDIRRAIAATTDEAARSRMRVRMVDLLFALGDAPAAHAELTQAVAEGPASAGLLLTVGVAAAPRLDGEQIGLLRAAIRARRPGAPPSSSQARPAPPQSRHGAASARARAAGSSSPVVPAPAYLEMSLAEISPEGSVVEQAFAALAQSKPVRARRLGEEAARLAPLDAAADGEQLRELVAELGRAGATRESLSLARSLLETDGQTVAGPSLREDALLALVQRAVDLGETEMATRWRADLQTAAPVRSTLHSAKAPNGDPRTSRPRASRQAALFATMEATAAAVGAASLVANSPPAATNGKPRAAVGGGGAPQPQSPASAARRADSYRLAFEAERMPRPRARLALRWAAALDAAGDELAAVAVLGRAINDAPMDVSRALRRARADLLRAAGRPGDLAAVIDGDVQHARGRERVELRLEQARLLDRSGDFDRALEVRLAALADAPGDAELLAPARQRLEAVGRLERSLELAAAAIPQVVDRAARAGLLRDVATLAEAAAGDRERAAHAWLEVLALYPEDVAAFEAAERLLRQLGDHERLGRLLAWSAGRQSEPAPRAPALWRLAEFHRERGDELRRTLPLYREMLREMLRESGREADRGAARIAAGGVGGLVFKDEDWQRRDDLLALHTARALVAPDSVSWAEAVAARADLLIVAGRYDDADRELGRTLERAPGVPGVIASLERLYDRRNDARGLRKRLMTAVEGVSGDPRVAQLWLGIGRANQKLGDVAAARAAYEHAAEADSTLREPVTSLRQLASEAADWAEVARMLEDEIALNPTMPERVALLVELGVLLAAKLNAASRAVEVLDAVLVLEPANTTALDAMFSAALTVGAWEKAMQALEALLSAGVALADTSQRYYSVGLAAEKAGQIDRALALYSRSYARNPVFRPTLERLSEVCFDRQQWENAWKATEHLLQRHGIDLDADARAALALRSALADLHVAQRMVAANRIAGMVSGPTAQGGLRDVADSWASMRLERRLLAGVDGDRRARVLARLGEVLALTSNNLAHGARAMAQEILAALAMVERRWADALTLLEAIAGDGALEVNRRCLFLVAAGDILLHQQGDVAGASLQYQRARLLNPHEPRLARPGIIQMGAGGGGADMPAVMRPGSTDDQDEGGRPTPVGPIPRH